MTNTASSGLPPPIMKPAAPPAHLFQSKPRTSGTPRIIISAKPEVRITAITLSAPRTANAPPGLTRKQQEQRSAQEELWV